MRALHAGERPLIDELELAARAVGDAAHALGHRGPRGVDNLLIPTEGGVALLPILEVNPRVTMGRIALAIAKRVKGVGAWFFVPTREVEDRAAFVAAVQAAHPHMVFTTDPHGARRVFTVACTGRDLAEVRSRWEALGQAWPTP